MALRSFSPAMMGSLLNKRFSRTVVLAGTVCIFLAAILLWSSAKSPKLSYFPDPKSHSIGGASNGFDIPSWLKPMAKSQPPELYPFETTSHFFPVSQTIEGKTTKELCASFPSYMTQRVQPVLKMGHGERREKIEAQLDSVSACFSNSELLIFSDLDETFRDRPVLDILADLPAAAYAVDNPDFDAYRTMQAMRRNGTLDVPDRAATSAAVNGWRLDKYKFLASIERAWAMKPGRDWYVFYETDTYVSWDNMFRFLSTLDPSRPLYLGSPSPGRVDETRKDKFKTWFANGGPGYVLSRAAVEALVSRRSEPGDGRYTVDPPLSLKWLELLRADCCGDSIVGWVLWNVGIALGGYWPLFNPHALHEVPYSDLYWCQPVVTLHRTSPKDMVDLWRWEHSVRQPDVPLLYRDLYKFRHPGSPSIRKDWDNGDWAWFPPPAGTDSEDACATACENQSECVQWLWRGLDARECVLMRQIRLGVARKPESREEVEKPSSDDAAKSTPKKRKVDYTSGWMTDRIEAWMKERPCEKVEWVGPSITRIF